MTGPNSHSSKIEEMNADVRDDPARALPREPFHETSYHRPRDVQ